MNGEEGRSTTNRSIGDVRQDITTLIRGASQAIIEGPGPRTLYFQGRGGLGKTFLLLNYLELAGVADTPIRVCRIIDMVDPETRKPLYLEQQLLHGLTSSEQPVDPALVDQQFQPYRKARQAYVQHLQYQPDVGQRLAADIARRESFIACWNSLSRIHPLVLRFDTLELLLGQSELPDDALILRPEARVGVERLVEWLVHALAGMQHTLAIFCGRPPRGYPSDAEPQTPAQFDRGDDAPNRLEDNQLARWLHAAGLLAEEDFVTLRPITDHQTILHYLEIYGMEQAPPTTELNFIKRITEGSPLLLTLYAECQQAKPPALFHVNPDTVTTRVKFEAHLIDTILNPLLYMRPDVPHAREQLTLTYCLYILSYARRGLTPNDLRAALAAVDPALDLSDTLLDDLRHEALVKSIIVPIGDIATELLYLHDEIWLLIDESGAPDQLGLRVPVLDKLCDLSGEQVRRIPEASRPEGLLRAMADHVYYAITRDFARGYRFYLTYMDHLLGQRNHEDALVLADVFWRMLTLTVVRPGGPTHLYRDLLSEARDLDYQTVLHYDRIHYSKLLRAQGLNHDGAKEAAYLLQDLVAERVLPDPATVIPDDLATWPRLLHLFADLLLAYADALTLAGEPADYAATARRIYLLLNGLLHDPARVDAHLRASRAEIPPDDPPLVRDDNLLRLRRGYLLGLSQRMLGQLHWQQLEYDEAIDRARAAHGALTAYHQTPLALDETADPVVPEQYLNDEVSDDIASVLNNMAFTMAETGNLPRALRISEQMVREHAPRVRPYYRTLILNTRAEILLRSHRYAEAAALLEKAQAAAQEANVGRALGLVALTRARVARWEMNEARAPRPEVEDYYRTAVALLRGEQDYLRDTYDEWARYLRDLAYWYRQVQDPGEEQGRLRQALDRVQEALTLLPADPGQKAVQRADLLETQVSVLNNLERYGEAWSLLDQIEAEVMAHPMPLYGQVVCGKLALQRGLLHLVDEARRDEREALRLLTIAMARCYVFGDKHRDQRTFERLVRDWVGSIPRLAYTTFIEDLRADRLFVGLTDLPYQQGAPLDNRRWNDAWEKAIGFMESLGVPGRTE